MRRPSPLPTPAGASSSRGRDEPIRPRRDDTHDAPSAAPSPEGAEPDPQDQDAQETAPIVPLLLPLPVRPVTPDEAAPVADPKRPDDAAATADPAAETGPVRMRDVWRAGRARRRALRAEVRRFTVRQRRRRMVWLGVAVSLVLLTVATVGAAYSPLFAVQRIQVVGNQQLGADEVAAALEGQVGTPLAAIDESAVKAALVQFPLVESYTLEARPPHDLIVRIVERTPIGVLSSASGYTLVDAAGVALATTPDAPEGHPLLDVTGGTGSRAFEAAGTVMRALPPGLRGQVTAVTASTADDVTLTMGATNTRVVWGSAEESSLKALLLEKIMVTRPPDGVAVYDVSSSEAVVVR
ncbi:FtsQ-type POTRA domain-containing protein [Microbacterium caowuchunii]|uniref:FtsQ-type POTRA domain-containing protein n=1 Tax=Microbacterium caowuchunii TaxID=2614638 RepID=UPI001247DF51|nr:FtsQ-type POTRA domain-containing protein [Microbacterium caowuchunii]QEW00288.1 FtsQ-type POTRA domain-containing protein [Microbacterium caowuchunii]